jgi:hypothetical protein
MTWKNIKKEKPITKKGSWTGLKSEVILVADDAGIFYIARMYESIDGVYFCNEENDTTISEVSYWSYIANLPTEL